MKFMLVKQKNAPTLIGIFQSMQLEAKADGQNPFITWNFIYFYHSIFDGLSLESMQIPQGVITFQHFNNSH